MLRLLEELPAELVGTNVFGLLSLKDIVMIERACCSKKSQQSFMEHIANCRPVVVPFNKYDNTLTLDWLIKTHCKLTSLSISLSDNRTGFHVQADNFDLQITSNTTIQTLKPLIECNKGCKVKSITIDGDQTTEFIEQLSVCTKNLKHLTIDYSNNCMDWLTVDILSRWKLTEVCLYGSAIVISLVLLVVQTCTELTSIELDSNNIDDSTVSAITQHCSKLETLTLSSKNITWISLLTLSERDLALKELDIYPIPNIPTADIARRCSHALSRIRTVHTNNLYRTGQDTNIIIPYLTGLINVYLTYYYPTYILLLTQHCHRLTMIAVCDKNCTVEGILSLCRANPLLQELSCHFCCGITDTMLLELIHACPHLHTFDLPCETNITDTGILALSEHCPQLQLLHINRCQNVTETAVLQLLQHCHKLTRLEVSSSSLSEETWTQLDRNTQKRVRRC